MTYLSRLVLNSRNPDAKRRLSDCQEMHRLIMHAFWGASESQTPRAALGVIYRVEKRPRSPGVTVLVQSQVKPDWRGLKHAMLLPTTDLPNPLCSSIDGHLDFVARGDTLVFRLHANLQKKTVSSQGPTGRKRNVRRLCIPETGACLDWLHGKSRSSGFRLIDAAVAAKPDVPGPLIGPNGSVNGLRSGAKLTLGLVQFDGRLRVTDPDAFRSAVTGGIDQAKAYGFGLLSFARDPGTAVPSRRPRARLKKTALSLPGVPAPRGRG